MNKGLVDLKSLRRDILKADFRGKSAFCFVDGDKLIKIYARKTDRGYIYLDTDKINDFSKYSADTIVFPMQYLYEKKKICGEIQEYIRNKSISHSFSDNTLINPLIENYELVLEDLHTYSNIIMYDLCSSNILYSNNNGFHIIDTSEWQFGNNTTRGNKYRFDSYIIRVLFNYLGIEDYISKFNHLNNNIKNSCNKLGRYGYELSHLLECNLNEDYQVIGLLFAYMNLYQKCYDQEINTLEDMKELTKMLKKG